MQEDIAEVVECRKLMCRLLRVHEDSGHVYLGEADAEAIERLLDRHTPPNVIRNLQSNRPKAPI